MPLYDHFHSPISDVHTWEAFHTRWAVALADDLNLRLPKRFLASAPQHLGPFVSADVAEMELLNEHAGPESNGAPPGEPVAENGNDGGVAVAAEKAVYSPPLTALTMPVSFPDEFHVEVRDTFRASRVLGVIELVSPGNKDDDNARVTFASKCLSYIAKGIGLVVIDIVTERRTNLHNYLVDLAGREGKFRMPGDPVVYSCSYLPVNRNREDAVDVLMWELAIGSALPTVPLGLKEFGSVTLNLETTYREACERSRIPT